MLERMKLKHIKLILSSKMSFAIKFVRTRMIVVLTKQSVSSLHMTPDAALTTTEMSNIGTSIVIAIMTRRTNVKRQSTLASSALAIVTGRIAIATSSLKS
jgi:hypothetical protein